MKINVGTSKRSGVKFILSLSKGLKIVDILTAAERGCKLKDISRESGISASALIPYIKTLERDGWCYRDERTKRYFVSPQKKDVFGNYSGKSDSRIARAAEREILRLSEKYNENVLLAVRRGSRVVFISKTESSRAVKIENDQLPDYPLHATAAGRAMLAFDKPDNIKEYLYGAKYELYTKYTIPNRAKLEAELEWTRKRGYAFNNREFEDFIIAVAAPIFFKGSAAASLIIQLPSFRYNMEECHAVAKAVKAAADRIKADLLEK